VRLAGKTGTSQVMRKKEGVKWYELPWEQRHHALFVGYAPLDRPELLVCVVVEHGGDAASVAAPIAARILLRAFGPEVKQGAVAAAVPPIWQNTSLPPPPTPKGQTSSPGDTVPSAAAVEPVRSSDQAAARPLAQPGQPSRQPHTRQ
jgi:penicillin-binding protein 2